MTTNIDLENLSKKYKINLDYVIYKDELYKIKYKPNLNIIINMASMNHKGTHWICLHTYKDFIFYSDSFGVEPPEEVIEYGKKYNKPIIYNDYQLEKLNGDNCGQLALFTLGLAQGKNIKQLLT